MQQESVTPGLTTPSAKILVIRRDNVGDLVCTLPLLRALRAQLPSAYIAALVNRYNAPVLAGNADVNRVFVYQKAKHRTPDESLAQIYWRRLRMVAELRALRFDWAFLPGGAQRSAQRYAQWIAARGVVTGSMAGTTGSHEVEQSCSLLRQIGLRYETPPAKLQEDRADVAALAERLRSLPKWGATRVIGIHISARKTSQRWPEDRFVALIDRLAVSANAAFILLWAPGSTHNALHPGDDEKASNIVGRLRQRVVVPVATRRLEELIAAIALCDHFICSDGGAMHLAAALGKPIVCLFGDSDAARWHPWGVPYELLQPQSRNVVDIVVEDVMQAYSLLSHRLSQETAS